MMVPEVAVTYSTRYSDGCSVAEAKRNAEDLPLPTSPVITAMAPRFTAYRKRSFTPIRLELFIISSTLISCENGSFLKPKNTL